MRILVVEDEVEIRTVLVHTIRTLLPELAVVFTEAADAETALAVLGRDEVDVMILDLGLPSLSPSDTIRAFAPFIHDVPTIILTGYDDSALAKESAAAGAVSYVTKPVEAHKIEFAVRLAIKRHSDNDLLVSMSEDSKLFKEKAEKFDKDLEEIKKLIKGDSPDGAKKAEEVKTDNPGG